MTVIVVAFDRSTGYIYDMSFHRASRILTLAALLFLTAIVPPASANDRFKPFYGSYVGTGIAEQMGKKVFEQRDLDVQIKPYKNNGFTLKWITVVRTPDGERDADGVKRREVEESFIPYQGKENVFIDAPKGGLFSKAELPNPLKGEPLRWASIAGATLTVYSMAITDSGASELQVYHRTLTEQGMSISFLRMHDEQTLVRLSGELVRAQ